MRLLIVNVNQDVVNDVRGNVEYINLHDPQQFNVIFENSEWDYAAFPAKNVQYTGGFYKNINNLSRVGNPQIIHTLRRSK